MFAEHASDSLTLQGAHQHPRASKTSHRSATCEILQSSCPTASLYSKSNLQSEVASWRAALAAAATGIETVPVPCLVQLEFVEQDSITNTAQQGSLKTLRGFGADTGWTFAQRFLQNGSFVHAEP